MEHILDLIETRFSSDEVAYITSGVSEVSYFEWAIRIKKTRSWLQSKKSMKSADRVGIYMPSSPDYVTLVFSIWSLGATAVLIPYSYPKPALDQLAKTANISLILTDTDIDIDIDTDTDTDTDIFRPLGRFDQDALVIFTSGTEGPPKGVVLTIKNLLFSALGTIDFLQLSRGETWQVTLPLWHIGGIMIPVRTLLSGGKFSFSDESNYISLVPTQLYRLMKDPKKLQYLQKQKVILLGGAFCSRELLERARDLKLPVLKTYGMTEMAAQITCTQPKSSIASSHLGKVIPYRELIIDDSGRIKVRGKSRFRCYLIDGKEVFPFDQNGFFTSNDLGIFDSSSNLKLLGRSDQCFVSGGENINPNHVENELLKIDGVIDACVVPYTHREFGQACAAFVKMGDNLTLDRQYLDHQMRKRVPIFMVPKVVAPYPDSNGIKPNRALFKEYIKEYTS